MVVAWKMMALRRRNHEDGGSMIDDDNADGTSVNKKEANENGGRDV